MPSAVINEHFLTPEESYETHFERTLCGLESVQDFLIKLDMKPCMHLVEISIFSLNHVIVRLTKIMNNLLKHLKILVFSYDIRSGDQLLLKKKFEIFYF